MDAEQSKHARLSQIIEPFEETLETTFLLCNHVVEALGDIMPLALSTPLLRVLKRMYPRVLPEKRHIAHERYHLRARYPRQVFYAMSKISHDTTVAQWNDVILPGLGIPQDSPHLSAICDLGQISLLTHAVEMQNVALVEHFAKIYPLHLNEPDTKEGPLCSDALTPDIARILLAHGADPDNICASLFGFRTALDLVDLKNVELLRVFVAAKASVTSENRRLWIQQALGYHF
jgi:hypothetical protein